MRLIDADTLKTDYFVPSTSSGTVSTQYVSLFQILNAPTIDAVEVVHGVWEKTSINLSACSNCGNCVLTERTSGYFYCPNCGAKMDGERRTDDA